MDLVFLSDKVLTKHNSENAHGSGGSSPAHSLDGESLPCSFTYFCTACTPDSRSTRCRCGSKCSPRRNNLLRPSQPCGFHARLNLPEKWLLDMPHPRFAKHQHTTKSSGVQPPHAILQPVKPADLMGSVPFGTPKTACGTPGYRAEENARCSESWRPRRSHPSHPPPGPARTAFPQEETETRHAKLRRRKISSATQK